VRPKIFKFSNLQINNLKQSEARETIRNLETLQPEI
jgi:hypothetical protein